MRVLVTGAAGQLGSELVRRLPQRGHSVAGVTRADADLTSSRQVDALLQRHDPEMVINCAAWTKVDAAESEPQAAYLANAVAPAMVAAACQRYGCRLIHLSTDYVFGSGYDQPIDEEGEVRPLNVYGSSKAAGEAAVRANAADSVIVRTSWLYGGEGPNFVLTMLRLARERGALRVVDDQTGSPTWTGHLAPALAALLETPCRGDLHLSNRGQTTWCGFARAIMEEAGLSVAVEALTTAEYPAAAVRPPYSVLSNERWLLLGMEPLPDWREGLRAYLEERSRPLGLGVATMAP